MEYLSRAQVERYFAEPRIQCLICKRRFRCINTAHLEKHGTTVDAYKAEFGLPASHGLVCPSMRESQSTRASDRWSSMSRGERAAHVSRLRDSVVSVERKGMRHAPYSRKEGASRLLSSPLAAYRLAGQSVPVNCSECGAAINRPAVIVVTGAQKFKCDPCKKERDRARHRDPEYIARRNSDPTRKERQRAYSAAAYRRSKVKPSD